MKVSIIGINLIKKYEGLRLTAYRCPSGILTIGYGHTKTVKPGMTINETMADLLLEQDIKEYEKGINELIKVALNQNQFDALVSLCFNIGVGAFGRSTLLKLLNNKDYNGAAEQFMRWVNGRTAQGLMPLPGLVKRRTEEKNLFLRN